MGTRQGRVLISTDDIYWLAGLLEGEGSFGIDKRSACPRLELKISDLDVVVRARRLMGLKSKIGTLSAASILVGPSALRRGQRSARDAHRFVAHGAVAAAWMMTLYTQMGARRRARIRKVLAAWRNHSRRATDPRGRLLRFETRRVNQRPTIKAA
jgi:hypothetical protein